MAESRIRKQITREQGVGMKKWIRVYQETARADQAYKDLRRLKERLSSLVGSIPDTKEPKFTGWFVLLKKNDKPESGFEFLGFFNPDISKDEPEWDMCLPIQSLETIEEFQGW